MSVSKQTLHGQRHNQPHKIRADKRPYAVDLRRQQALCEANYVRLCKLLPEIDQHDNWEYLFASPQSDGQGGVAGEKIQLQVLQRAPYTLTLDVKQAWASHPYEQARELRVRMYHDARMAEVVAWNQQWNTRSRYDYPNARMQQEDEKYQLNCFLGEWLAHCLARGQVEIRLSS